MDNQTTVNEFILLTDDPHSQPFLFLVFFLIYGINLMGNLLTMLVIQIGPHLPTSIYIFLNFLPLPVDLRQDLPVDRHGVLLLLGELPAIMLHWKLGLITLAGSWSLASGVVNVVVNTLPVLCLDFCGPNQNPHFNCELELPPLLQISCSNTFASEMDSLSLGVSLGLVSFLLTLISYIRLISALFQIRSSCGHGKTISTCFSQLTVILLFYRTAFFQYLRTPSAPTPMALDWVVSVQYSILTPMLNAII
ncbi:olfactory receptor 5V1-like [Tachyglossus aculeatus]|uniref:olfactory receptor 5V1-like n=1 Tax=Tachyglossus aculeatus TaxID=9261 RepID=UPI0018F3D5E7|nr:olfactory receptor 5V1-like [Tachyglossus aculeatus]